MSEEAPLLATPLLTTLLTTPSVTELIQDPGPRAAEGPWGVNLRIHRIKQCNGGQFSPISDQSAPRKCRHLRYSVGFGRTLANFAQIDAGNPTSGGQQTGAWSRIVYKIESPSWGLFRQQSTNFSTTPYIIEMPKSILFKPVGIRNAHQSQSLGMGNFRVGAQVSAEFGPNSAKIRPRSAKLEENWRESTSFGPKSGRVQQSSYTFGRGRPPNSRDCDGGRPILPRSRPIYWPEFDLRRLVFNQDWSGVGQNCRRNSITPLGGWTQWPLLEITDRVQQLVSHTM